MLSQRESKRDDGEGIEKIGADKVGVKSSAAMGRIEAYAYAG